MFTSDEKQNILDLLPKLSIKYEPKITNAFKSELYYVIPKGPKSLLWYTKWQHTCVCFLIHLTENNAYKDISIVSHSAVPELTSGVGTIVYGTHFSYRKQGFFTCEQLYYYRGENVSDKPFHNILYLLHELFTEFINEPIINATSSIVIGLPVMATTFVEAEKASLNIPYKVYGIGAHRSQNYNKPNGIEKSIQEKQTPREKYNYMKIQPVYHIPLLPLPMQPMQPMQPTNQPTNQHNYQQYQYQNQNQNQSKYNHNNHNHNHNNNHHNQQPTYQHYQQPSQPTQPVNLQLNTCIFNVKADESAEIYNLYTADSALPYAVANISTLKTSNMMYNIFHNIDSGIKSIDDDSALDLDKVVTMECSFSKENKKWTPIRQTYAISRLVTSSQLQYYGLTI